MSKFVIFFILVYIAGLAGTIFYHGASAFMLYQMVYLINPENQWWYSQVPSLRYSFITAVVMILALLFNYRRLTAQAPWTELPVLKWWLLFLLLHFVTAIWAVNPLIHNMFSYEFFKSTIIFMVAYKLLHSEKHLDLSLWVYMLGCTYMGYIVRSFGRSSSGRVEGIGMIDTGGDANLFAAVVVPSLVVMLYYAWQGNWKVRLIIVICSAFVVNTLVLVNSRGAFLGALVGCGIFICYMLFSRFQKAGQRATAIFIIIAGLVGAYSLTDATFWQRMQTLQADEDGQRGGDGRGRIYYWFATFDMLRDHKLGMGIGGFQTLSEVYLENNKVPHSMWFQVLGEFSWHGLALYLTMLLSVLRLSYLTKQYLMKNNETERYFKVVMLECSLISFLVTGSFIDRARAEILYWLILYLSVAGNVLYLQKIRATKTDTTTISKTPTRLSPARARTRNMIKGQ